MTLSFCACARAKCQKSAHEAREESAACCSPPQLRFPPCHAPRPHLKVTRPQAGRPLGTCRIIHSTQRNVGCEVLKGERRKPKYKIRNPKGILCAFVICGAAHSIALSLFSVTFSKIINNCCRRCSDTDTHLKIVRQQWLCLGVNLISIRINSHSQLHLGRICIECTFRGPNYSG